MKKQIFVTAINCMDGRTQLPVIQYLTEKNNANYVDMITEPGPVKLLAENLDTAVIARLRHNVLRSIQLHQSRLLAVVAHADCAGNPVADRVQQEQLRQAVKTATAWNLSLDVIGLWIDEQWRIVPQ